MSEKKSYKQNEKTDKETANDDPVSEAHRLAEKDIESDPDLKTEPEPEDDLDEGELARFEGED